MILSVFLTPGIGAVILLSLVAIVIIIFENKNNDNDHFNNMYR